MIISMKLSKFSLFLGAYIIISAYFMNQVLNTWRITFGKNSIILSFILLSAWAMIATLYRSIKIKFNLIKIALICGICAAGFIFAWKQPYLSEKAHVLEYGLLGWLAMRDLAAHKTAISKSVLYTLIFVAIIALLDEGFQGLLPWRVYEARDIITNVLSGLLGTLLFIVK
ncbi:MAG: VanZ family protein [Candidatus Omnitrophica bacterium]|nr:VanZ family protein [Candidatus Omnitrophota bacterium]